MPLPPLAAGGSGAGGGGGARYDERGLPPALAAVVMVRFVQKSAEELRSERREGARAEREELESRALTMEPEERRAKLAELRASVTKVEPLRKLCFQLRVVRVAQPPSAREAGGGLGGGGFGGFGGGGGLDGGGFGSSRPPSTTPSRARLASAGGASSAAPSSAPTTPPPPSQPPSSAGSSWFGSLSRAPSRAATASRPASSWSEAADPAASRPPSSVAPWASGAAAPAGGDGGGGGAPDESAAEDDALGAWQRDAGAAADDPSAEWQAQQRAEQRAGLRDATATFAGPAALASLCAAGGAIADDAALVQVELSEEEVVALLGINEHSYGAATLSSVSLDLACPYATQLCCSPLLSVSASRIPGV